MPPAALTTTPPVVALPGTVALMLVLLHEFMEAVTPLNVTLPLPCDGPKLLPPITTDDNVGPLLGVKLLMFGAGVTTKATPLLATPPAAATTTFPLVAPEGTATVMLLVVQEAIAAVTPLKVTELPAPWELKLDPAMTIEEPIAPELGVRLAMLGAGVTVKATPLLATPVEAVTTTFPVVAPEGTVAVMLLVAQDIIGAVTPLKVTWLPIP